MKKLIAISAFAALTMQITGCATIINDKTQRVNVTTSNGEKSELTIAGKTFEAPGIVDVKRSQDPLIIESKTDKCASKTVANSKVDPVFFVNILSGGAFGSTTDYASDKMWKYEDTIQVSCK